MNKSYRGKIGWDMGMKFKVLSQRKWDNDTVLKIRCWFPGKTLQCHIEYISLAKAKQDRMFCFTEDGKVL